MRNCAAIFLLGIWLAIGAWFYVCKVKKLCKTLPKETTSTVEKTSNPVSQPSTLTPTLLKKAYNKVFQVEEDISFEYSRERIQTGPLFDSGIDSLSTFLKNNPSTKLIITGYYGEEEDNTSTFSDLGLARAAHIQQQLIGSGVEEEQLITISKTSNSLFSDTDQYHNIIDFKFSQRYEYLNESDIKSTYQAIRFLERYTQFDKDGKQVFFTETPDQSIETLQYYLNRNRSHSLLVNVPYQEDEIYLEDTLNIGLLRSLDLKKKLVDIALKEESILISTDVKSTIFTIADVSRPGVVDYNFVFPNEHDEALQKELALERALSKSLSIEVADATVVEEKTTDTEKVDFAKSTITSSESSSPLTFTSGSYTLPLTNSIVEYIQDLKAHLAENPDRHLLIIGHTDNVGDPEYNIELGRLRGYEARRLLINHQIAPRRIKVTSEGEYSPIADNQEAAGRRLNRRVDIDII